MERLNRIYTLDEIKVIAGQIAEWTDQATVVTFQGNLGAGKTTLIRALCNIWGISGGVSSPTFSLVNTYETAENLMPHRIHHMDFYRLASEEEAYQAGLEELLHSGDKCLVEWPQRAPGIIPPNAIHIFLETAGPNQRRIKVLTNQND